MSVKCGKRCLELEFFEQALLLSDRHEREKIHGYVLNVLPKNSRYGERMSVKCGKRCLELEFF